MRRSEYLLFASRIYHRMLDLISLCDPDNSWNFHADRVVGKLRRYIVMIIAGPSSFHDSTRSRSGMCMYQDKPGLSIPVCSHLFPVSSNAVFSKLASLFWAILSSYLLSWTDRQNTHVCVDKTINYCIIFLYLFFLCQSNPKIIFFF